MAASPGHSDWNNSFEESFADDDVSVGSNSLGPSSPVQHGKAGSKYSSPVTLSQVNLLSKCILSRASMKEVVKSANTRGKVSACKPAGRLHISSNSRGTWSSSKIREWQEYQRLGMRSAATALWAHPSSHISSAEDSDDEALPPVIGSRLDKASIASVSRATDHTNASDLHAAYSVYLRAREQKRKDQMEGVPKDFYELNRPKIRIYSDAEQYRHKKRNIQGRLKQEPVKKMSDKKQTKFHPKPDRNSVHPQQKHLTQDASVFSPRSGDEVLGLGWSLSKMQCLNDAKLNAMEGMIKPAKSAPLVKSRLANNTSHTRSIHHHQQTQRRVCHKSFPIAQGLKREGVSSAQVRWRPVGQGDLDIYKVWARKTNKLSTTPAAMAKTDVHDHPTEPGQAPTEKRGEVGERARASSTSASEAWLGRD